MLRTDEPFVPATGAAAARTALLIAAVLIAYGSLYPLQFAAPAAHAWSAFFQSFGARSSPSDILGNVALFLPFGLCMMLALPAPANHLYRVTLVVIVATIYATVLQFVQIAVPRRVPALIDVVWNLLGTGAGIALAYPLAASMRRRRLQTDKLPLPILLLLFFAVSELLPLVPTLDVEALKDSLKPLLLHPEWRASAALQSAAGLLAAGWLLRAWRPQPGGRAAVVLLAGALALGKVLVLTQTLSWSEVSGWTLACGIWFIRHRQLSPATVITFLIAAFTLAALEPFTLRSSAADLNLMPFADVLDGRMLNNVSAMTPRLFVYAMLLYFVPRNALVPAALLLAGWVLVLEFAQCFISGRLGTISEPLWVLLLAAVYRRRDDTVRSDQQGRRT